MSKYPKSWPVGGHPVAEAKVRQLKKHNSPWLRASGPDGNWIAEKQGKLSNVKHGTEGAWFCMGYEDGLLGDGVKNDGIVTVVRATDFDQPFRKIADHDYTAELQYVSKPWYARRRRDFTHLGGLSGWRMALKNLVAESFYIAAFDIELQSSMLGGSWNPQLILNGLGIERYTATAKILTAGKRVSFEQGAEQLTRSFIVMGIGRYGDAIQPAGYVSYNGRTDWQLLTFGKELMYQGAASYHLSSPGVLLACVPVYVVDEFAAESLGVAVNGNARLSYLAEVDVIEGGVTDVPAGDLLDFDEEDFPDDIETAGGGSKDPFNFRIATATSSIVITRLAEGGMLAVAPARHYDSASSGNRARRLATFVSSGSGSFVRQGNIEIGDGEIDGFPRQLHLVGETPVMKLIPTLGSPDIPPRLVVWDKSGASFIVKELPFPAYRCGEITVIDQEEFGITAYTDEDENGKLVSAYRFYTTKDFGETWEVASKIHEKAPAPDEPNANEMYSFQQVTWIRTEAGAPSSITPGAPWISDGRRKEE